jgi:hypothetical protein
MSTVVIICTETMTLDTPWKVKKAFLGFLIVLHVPFQGAQAITSNQHKPTIKALIVYFQSESPCKNIQKGPM